MAYKYEMTNDHRKLLEHMMGWYWNVGKQQNLITPSDYDFLYNLWNNGVTSYDDTVSYTHLTLPTKRIV